MGESGIVMFDDQAAAKPHTMDGWLARDGHFYRDERAARFAGCTHRPCESCGTPTPKMYTKCPDCRARDAAARYEARPEASWDGKRMVYSEVTEEFYSSPDEAWEMEECEDGDLRLVLCDPQYVRPLERDYCEDELPEDGELPDEVVEAMDAFNAATHGTILSWYPGKYRLLLDQPSPRQSAEGET